MRDSRPSQHGTHTPSSGSRTWSRSEERVGPGPGCECQARLTPNKSRQDEGGRTNAEYNDKCGERRSKNSAKMMKADEVVVMERSTCVTFVWK